ncbi:MAG: DUF3656 domain-containing protein [Planctomycetota bacterium]|nr:DUF3656 domain-containing protein [Planctomycetota bacterium]
MTTVATQPELLAPAGDWDALRAACANGANAVYFGLSSFSARHRATNFTLAELPNVMHYLHDRNVRGYVAFNTLIFSDELAEATRLIAAMVEAGVDAVIVQDLGLARLIHRLAPGLPMHGSTQMTLTEASAIEFVRRLGVDRVILARELSLDNISQIAKKTTVPLEVFVHGALCVAYSGQCLTSEAIGGRSANRGQCAQACRLPYDLVVDGEQRDFGERAYLLSPQDLAAYDLIDSLLELGVCSFKIEGRLKSAHYVAATSQSYRAALDAAIARRPFELSSQGKIDLSQTFSRGFTHGFLDGVDHQLLVPARFPKSRGLRVGTVVSVTSRGVVVELEPDLPADIIKPGDGVVFDEGHPDQQEQGGRVYHVRPASSQERSMLGRTGSHYSSTQMHVALGENVLNLEALTIGCIVWRTDDPVMRKRLEQSFNRESQVALREGVRFELDGMIGGAVTVAAIDLQNRRATSTWPGPLEVARKHPLNDETLREQLGRLGDTPFELGAIDNRLPADCMLPKSVLNELRRDVMIRLLQTREAAVDRTLHVQALPELREDIAAVRSQSTPAGETNGNQLHVLVRSMEHLEAVLQWQPPDGLPPPATIYCDFENVRRYRDAVPLVRDAGRRIGLATLRIMKPGEEGLLAVIEKAEPDCVLIRNLASLMYFKTEAPQMPLFGDYALNVANEITADLFRSEGLQRMVPSYDLSWEQLTAMLGRIDPRLFEVVVHQHMPMFHMEHCVFAAMLSEGKDWRDCGRPCDTHKVELRDRTGADFPLVADTGCRNTVYNSVAQSAAEYIPRMLNLGVRHFRLELLREEPVDVAELLDRYSRVIAGIETGRGTFRSLQVLNQLGVTRGTLQRS